LKSLGLRALLFVNNIHKIIGTAVLSKSKYRITRRIFGRDKTPEGALRFFQKFMDGFVLNHYIKNVIFHSVNQSILNSYLYPI
jgi:hypothetical protein